MRRHAAASRLWRSTTMESLQGLVQGVSAPSSLSDLESRGGGVAGMTLIGSTVRGQLHCLEPSCASWRWDIQRLPIAAADCMIRSGYEAGRCRSPMPIVNQLVARCRWPLKIVAWWRSRWARAVLATR